MARALAPGRVRRGKPLSRKNPRLSLYLLVAAAGLVGTGSAAHADVVTDWNAATLDAVRAAQAPLPIASARSRSFTPPCMTPSTASSAPATPTSCKARLPRARSHVGRAMPPLRVYNSVLAGRDRLDGYPRSPSLQPPASSLHREGVSPLTLLVTLGLQTV